MQQLINIKKKLYFFFTKCMKRSLTQFKYVCFVYNNAPPYLFDDYEKIDFSRLIKSAFFPDVALSKFLTLNDKFITHDQYNSKAHRHCV